MPIPLRDDKEKEMAIGFIILIMGGSFGSFLLWCLIWALVGRKRR